MDNNENVLMPIKGISLTHAVNHQDFTNRAFFIIDRMNSSYVIHKVEATYLPNGDVLNRPLFIDAVDTIPEALACVILGENRLLREGWTAKAADLNAAAADNGLIAIARQFHIARAWINLDRPADRWNVLPVRTDEMTKEYVRKGFHIAGCENTA